jgi:hypothetical protein
MAVTLYSGCVSPDALAFQAADSGWDPDENQFSEAGPGKPHFMLRTLYWIMEQE